MQTVQEKVNGEDKNLKEKYLYKKVTQKRA